MSDPSSSRSASTVQATPTMSAELNPEQDSHSTPSHTSAPISRSKPPPESLAALEALGLRPINPVTCVWTVSTRAEMLHLRDQGFMIVGHIRDGKVLVDRDTDRYWDVGEPLASQWGSGGRRGSDGRRV